MSSKNKNKVAPVVYLAPYLPYKLTCFIKNGKKYQIDFLQAIYNDANKAECTFFNIVESQQGFKSVKPILKPLEDLLQDEKTCNEINVFLKENGFAENDFQLFLNSLHVPGISWMQMQHLLNFLYREHYDVLGLIDQDLAVSIYDLF
jgi:hypothetical protein